MPTKLANFIDRLTSALDRKQQQGKI